MAKKSAGTIAINDALVELGLVGSNFKAPTYKAPDYNSIINSYKVDSSKIFKDTDYSGVFTPSEADKKKGFTPNLFDFLSGTLGQFGGAVTNYASNVIDAVQDEEPLWKQILGTAAEMSPQGFLKDLVRGKAGDMEKLNPLRSVGQGVKAGAKQQMEDWTDGGLSWGDVPGIGFAHGMDKGWKRGDDIMEQFGVENKWGKLGGGLAIDIALDPLTYLTGGLSTATKLKKGAEAVEIATQGAKFGLKGVKSADEVLSAAVEHYTTKFPNLAQNTKVIDKKIASISDNITAAGAKAFNDNINKWGAAVPFTNKVKPIGNIGEKNLLHRSEALVPQKTVDNLLSSLSEGSKLPKDDILKTVLKTYDVEDTSKFTKTMFDDLATKAQSVTGKTYKGLPDANVVEKITQKEVTDPINDIIKNIDPNTTTTSMGDAFAAVSGKIKPTIIDDISRSADILKDGNPVSNQMRHSRELSKALNEPYMELKNAKTRFEHGLDKINPFDSRTLKTSNQFINSFGDEISDASSQRIGETASYKKVLSGLENYIKKNDITQDDMKDAIYHIEGQAPKSYGDTWQASDKAKGLADQIKPILDEIAGSEQSGGVLSRLRDNYFPHIVNKTEADLKKIREAVERQGGKLTGNSAANAHNQSRTGFETIAQRDDYLVKLEKEIQKETDPEVVKTLTEQQKEIENLFDTDIVSALTRRVREGVRSKAMKDMQGKLSKFNMMVSNPKNIEEESIAAGLQKLTAEEAKKLGLKEGAHYIHPDVLSGLKKVDELFTDQGMNKLVRDVNAITDIWKNLVTTYKPSHYMNNFIGNAMMNMAAGVSVTKDYPAAARLIKGYRNGTLSPEDMKFMKEAFKNNVMSGGFITDSMFNFHFDDPRALEKAALKVSHNKGINNMKELGERVDDFTRLANYMGGMRKYGSSKKAAQQVREYLFNYNELTTADRGMRIVVPFWNWVKRNVPLQMKTLMENPKFATNIARTQQYWNADSEGADYQKESGLAIPKGISNLLGGDDQQYYSGLPSPTNDLNTVLGLGTPLISSMNPLAGGIIETNMNKNLFTKNPITYGQDEMAPEDFPRYLASKLGIVDNISDAATGEKDPLEALINLFKPISKVREE